MSRARTGSRPNPKRVAIREERLDATPERLARAKEAGQSAPRDALDESTPGKTRRLLDPFDVMRSNRVLAPHDARLNDIRWLIGESLRRTHHRARLDGLRAVALERVGSTGFGPRPGLPQAEAALHARDRLREAEDRVGPAAWPILTRIVIEGGGVRECRGFVPELATPWRADAVVTDRLRVGLDLLGALIGGDEGNAVTARGARCPGSAPSDKRGRLAATARGDAVSPSRSASDACRFSKGQQDGKTPSLRRCFAMRSPTDGPGGGRAPSDNLTGTGARPTGRPRSRSRACRSGRASART